MGHGKTDVRAVQHNRLQHLRRPRLAKSDPGNLKRQRNLSIPYQRIGEVQVAQGDLSGALKSHSNSLAIKDRLAQSDPTNGDWQEGLSLSYEQIGDVLVAQGDLAGASTFLSR